LCTFPRWVRPDAARSLALECRLRDNDPTHWLHNWRDHAGSCAFDLHSGGLRESQAVFIGGNHGRNQGAWARLINGELGGTASMWQTESVGRVWRSSESLEAGLHPGQSRSGRFGFQMRGATCAGMEASAASTCRGRAASLRSAGQARRPSFSRERHTRSSSFSCCAAPPFHDASNCFRINPAS